MTILTTKEKILTALEELDQMIDPDNMHTGYELDVKMTDLRSLIQSL